MFRFFRLLLSLAMLAAFIWFATSVRLGKRTLWGHLSAIFATQAAKDLAEGTRDAAEKVARRVRSELKRDAGEARSQPLDPVDERDRKGLDHLVHKKVHE